MLRVVVNTLLGGLSLAAIGVSAYGVTSQQSLDDLIGDWVNGYGDYIRVEKLDGLLFLEIKDHCYHAVIIPDGDGIIITPILPDVFCQSTPEGISGTLDAVRSALGKANDYEISDDLLQLRNQDGRILAGFDRVVTDPAPLQATEPWSTKSED